MAPRSANKSGSARAGAKTKKYAFDRIIARKEEGGVVWYQVRWKGYSARHDTWEPRDMLMEDVANDVLSFDEEMEGLDEPNDAIPTSVSEPTSGAIGAANKESRSGRGRGAKLTASRMSAPSGIRTSKKPVRTKKAQRPRMPEEVDDADVTMSDVAGSPDHEPTCDETFQEDYQQDHGDSVKACQGPNHRGTTYHVCETCHDEAGTEYSLSQRSIIFEHGACFALCAEHEADRLHELRVAGINLSATGMYYDRCVCSQSINQDIWLCHGCKQEAAARMVQKRMEEYLHRTRDGRKACPLCDDAGEDGLVRQCAACEGYVVKDDWPEEEE
ncbi:M-phase phosphoprotein 8 [Taxawa tesnikishii (nom. ined.)]|nr:M-phase phosphoprotein 8 [Dothideales sp. JES 119]